MWISFPFFRSSTGKQHCTSPSKLNSALRLKTWSWDCVQAQRRGLERMELKKSRIIHSLHRLTGVMVCVACRLHTAHGLPLQLTHQTLIQLRNQREWAVMKEEQPQLQMKQWHPVRANILNMHFMNSHSEGFSMMVVIPILLRGDTRQMTVAQTLLKNQYMCN